MELALARTPDVERPARVRHCVSLLASGVLDPRGVWIARRNQDIVGVQVCVPLAGAACLFWLPRRMRRMPRRSCKRRLCWCRSIGCKIAQCLVVPDEYPLVQPLLRQGFRHTTRMHTLRHDLCDVPPDDSSTLRFETFRPSLRADFVATLEPRIKELSIARSSTVNAASTRFSPAIAGLGNFIPNAGGWCRRQTGPSASCC